MTLSIPLPFEGDSIKAYFTGKYSLRGGISSIKSLYTSDPEEKICFSTEIKIGKQIYNDFPAQAVQALRQKAQQKPRPCEPYEPS